MADYACRVSAELPEVQRLCHVSYTMYLTPCSDTLIACLQTLSIDNYAIRQLVRQSCVHNLDIMHIP